MFLNKNTKLSHSQHSYFLHLKRPVGKAIYLIEFICMYLVLNCEHAA